MCGYLVRAMLCWLALVCLLSVESSIERKDVSSFEDVAVLGSGFIRSLRGVQKPTRVSE